MSHPERIIPDETSAGILALHLKRYDFARTYVDGKDVLDAACGVGYGTAYLAETAAQVVGIDVDRDAVVYAAERYPAPNIAFQQMDVTSLSFPDASFDVVVSFETLEHLADPAAAAREAARVLRDCGVYVASTPRADVTDTAPENPFHTIEYSPEDFAELLGDVFKNVELYGQRRRETRRHKLLRNLDVFGIRRRMRVPGVAAITGSQPTTDLMLADIEIERGKLRGASEIIAVCR
jgi:SAM-dependent methyltransferase